MFNSIMFILQSLMFLIPILISVAFLTLVERKVLGYMQFRKGPKVVGIYGIMQPFADALKLFLKETMKPSTASPYLFFFSPFLFLLLALMVWSMIPLPKNTLKIKLSLLLILGMSSMAVYALLGAGWASNSKYSLMGSIRAVAQMMSYEMSIGLIMLSLIMWPGTFSLKDMKEMQKKCWLLVPYLPLTIMWFVSSLAETNRAPFDLTEGESELVSGYKVEYAGGPFALFFMAEYAKIMFINLLSTMLFLGGSKPFTLMPFLASFILAMKTMFLTFSFLWVRASLPRLRYDQLMHLIWKNYLPFSIGILSLSLSLIMMKKSSSNLI